MEIYAYIMLGIVFMLLMFLADIPDMYRQYKNLKGQK